MKDPIDALESFYQDCRTAEAPSKREGKRQVGWPSLIGAVGIGVAATFAVVMLTPRPRTDESAAAHYLQEAQLAQKGAKENASWRG